MRPVTVYANPSDEDYHLLIAELRQWRVAVRLVMMVLSASGWPPAEIAAVLHYHPGTVRRWIGRHHTEGMAGLPGRPRSGAPPGWPAAG